MATYISLIKFTHQGIKLQQAGRDLARRPPETSASELVGDQLAVTVEVEQQRWTAGASRFQVKQMFGDDKHVCLVGEVSAERLIGSQHLRGADLPYSTYECIVYRIANGKVAESTGSTPTSNSDSLT